MVLNEMSFHITTLIWKQILLNKSNCYCYRLFVLRSNANVQLICESIVAKNFEYENILVVFM